MVNSRPGADAPTWGERGCGRLRWGLVGLLVFALVGLGLRFWGASEPKTPPSLPAPSGPISSPVPMEVPSSAEDEWTTAPTTPGGGRFARLHGLTSVSCFELESLWPDGNPIAVSFVVDGERRLPVVEDRVALSRVRSTLTVPVGATAMVVERGSERAQVSFPEAVAGRVVECTEAVLMVPPAPMTVRFDGWIEGDHIEYNGCGASGWTAGPSATIEVHEEPGECAVHLSWNRGWETRRTTLGSRGELRPLSYSSLPDVQDRAEVRADLEELAEGLCARVPKSHYLWRSTFDRLRAMPDRLEYFQGLYEGCADESPRAPIR